MNIHIPDKYYIPNKYYIPDKYLYTINPLIIEEDYDKL